MAKEGETALHSILAHGRSRKKTMQERPGYFVAENKDRYRRFTEMPQIYTGETDIRYSPHHGTIAFSSFRSLPPSIADKGSNQIVGKHGNKPEKILASVRINEFSDIESSIRACIHILENVGRKKGTQVQNVLAISHHIASMLDTFVGKRVTREIVQQLAQETEKVLEKSGYASAVKPNKQVIAYKMLSALEPDSLGRPINNLRTTVMLASAWTLSHEESIHSGFSQAKYERFLSTLLASRSIYRHALSRMGNTLSLHLSLERDHNGIIQARRSQIPPPKVPSAVENIANTAKNVLQPHQVKIAPYRQAGLSASYIFFGPELQRPKERKDYMHMMLSLLGNDWFDHVDSFAPLLISGRGTDNAQTARDVVTRGLFAARVIDAALLQGEQCLLHEDAYNDLITSDKIVDIWSAAQRNMVA